MSAALKIEFEPFALKDQHHSPPDKKDRTQHCGERSCLRKSGQLKRRVIFGDEIPSSVSTESIAKFLVNSRLCPAIFFVDFPGFRATITQLQSLTLFIPLP